MHPSCWICRSANAFFASTCLCCGHRVWKDRVFDLLIFVGFVVSLVLLRKVDTSVP